MKVDRNLLFKFFAKENTPAEADTIAAWLRASDAHLQEFENAYKLFAVSQIALSKAQTAPVQASRRILPRRWIAFGAAAVLALVLVVGDHLRQDSLIRETTLTSEAGWGRQLTQTLSDGTAVSLNAGARITWPALFHGTERRVHLEGEALFDVTHDPDRPFVVETGVYDVQVLGTRFDVAAFPADGTFSVTLLEGSVKVLDKEAHLVARLAPGQQASVRGGGTLQVETLEDASESILWTEDLLSLGGLRFPEMMERFEKTFGVDISIDLDEIPAEVLPYCKVRISEGIISAFTVLRHHYDFAWEFDVQENVYHIIQPR